MQKMKLINQKIKIKEKKMKNKLLENILREAIETATIKAGETAKDIFNKQLVIVYIRLV